jgi:hypothetical protein
MVGCAQEEGMKSTTSAHAFVSLRHGTWGGAMLRVICCIPRCPSTARGRREIMCAEHWTLAPPLAQKQLHTTWKAWRTRKGGLGQATYAEWHGLARRILAAVLVELWEAAFPIPLGAHYCHAYGTACGCGLPSPCQCPMCQQARVVAFHQLGTRRLIRHHEARRAA